MFYMPRNVFREICVNLRCWIDEMHFVYYYSRDSLRDSTVCFCWQSEIASPGLNAERPHLQGIF